MGHQFDGCCRFKDLVTDGDVPRHRRFRSDPDVVAREIIKGYGRNILEQSENLTIPA